jgi:hypothetical protein
VVLAVTTTLVVFLTVTNGRPSKLDDLDRSPDGELDLA